MPPVLVKPIAPQVVNERAAYGPLNLKEFIQAANPDLSVNFQAELRGGAALPKGIICTSDGILTGIPGEGTLGNYEILLTAKDEEGEFQTTFPFTIKPTLQNKGADYLDQIKTQVWIAVDQRLPIPDLGELYDRPISALEIYHLLERWGILKIWDAYNLDPPGPMKELNLSGASPHYHVYDRGSHIIAVPKDLFSHERTLEDGLITAQAMAREVFERQWTIELAGFDKFTRACWVELQHLGDRDKLGRHVDVINYDPSPDDVKLYSSQAFAMRIGGGR